MKRRDKVARLRNSLQDLVVKTHVSEGWQVPPSFSFGKSPSDCMLM
jgi:hypothetical protein